MMKLDYIAKGDSAELLQQMPEKCVDLVVTSPPYDNLRTYNGHGNSWNFDKFKTIADGLLRVVKDGGVIVWIVSDSVINGDMTATPMKQALYFKSIGFNLHDTMIWNKNGFTSVGSTSVRYPKTWEYMFVFSKGKPNCFNPIKDRKNKHAGKKIHGTIRNPDGTMKKVSGNGEKVYREFGIRFNVWDVNPARGNTVGHPAIFPERLAADNIVSWSNVGDVVLDPFMGSGTTALAAMKNGRHFIGFEICDEYYDIAVRRIEEYRRCSDEGTNIQVNRCAEKGNA